eukprot:10836515-Alexandrium_andersonii.AAC.1
MPDFIALPASPGERSPFPFALGAAGTRRPARSIEGSGLAALAPALARAEDALQDRKRRLELLGVGVAFGRFGLEGSDGHAHGG